MGTDIHLEAERLIDGKWERIPHEPEPCWSCGEYNRDLHAYINQTGVRGVICKREEMLPDDVVNDNRGEWVVLERVETCPYCNGTKFTHPQFLKSRNYDVFAIFADVRNGRGFAGVVTSSGFEPIAPGRGIPDDLSQEVIAHLERLGYHSEDGELVYDRALDEDPEGDDLYAEMERERDGYWSLGEHSFTWLRLSEILDYDWNRSVVKEGWVDPVEYEEFRTLGSPSSWAGGVAGANVSHITATEMADRIDSGDFLFEDRREDDPPYIRRRWTTSLQREMATWDLPQGSVGAKVRDATHYVCPIQWEVPYAHCTGSGFWQEIEILKSLAPDGDYSRVRLVMGFDS